MVIRRLEIIGWIHHHNYRKRCQTAAAKFCSRQEYNLHFHKWEKKKESVHMQESSWIKPTMHVIITHKKKQNIWRKGRRRHR